MHLFLRMKTLIIRMLLLRRLRGSVTSTFSSLIARIHILRSAPILSCISLFSKCHLLCLVSKYMLWTIWPDQMRLHHLSIFLLMPRIQIMKIFEAEESFQKQKQILRYLTCLHQLRRFQLVTQQKTKKFFRPLMI